MRSRSYLAPFLVVGILLLGSYASAAPVTNPSDPRTWQGATVQTFADVLTLVEGHPVTAQDVINRQLLDDGVFPLTANVVFPTTPISDGPCPQSTVKLPTGIMLSQSSPACYGYSMNPTDYSYVLPYYFIPPYNFPPPGLWPCSSTPQSDPAFDLPNLILSGSCLDMWWAQEQGNGSALYVAQGPVWDLGGQANQVAVFAIADHEPLPQEAIEHTVYLSNNRNATEAGSDGNTQWVLATLKKVYLEGWRSD